MKYRVCGVYFQEPRGDVYHFKLNFKISKLAYSDYISGENLDTKFQVLWFRRPPESFKAVNELS